jgi:hypothetical protein
VHDRRLDEGDANGKQHRNGNRPNRGVPDWRSIKDLDGHRLDREIREAGWTFFFLASEIRAAVFGINGRKMVRRPIKDLDGYRLDRERILTSSKMGKSSSLEITRVTSVGSERFPRIRYVTVSAHPRHYPGKLFLFCGKDLQEFGPSRIDCAPKPRHARGMELPLEETMRQSDVATILNL